MGERIIYRIEISFPENSRAKVKEALKVLKESVVGYHQVREYHKEMEWDLIE